VGEMIKIAPSILSADFSKLREEIEIVENGGAEILHIDVMDGHFVPNITIGPPVVKSIRKHSEMIFDVHLMISNPEKYIVDFANAGADIISVHYEATKHVHRAIQIIKNEGKKCCVSLNPATPICVLENLYEELDMILLMTVNPGFGGQKYIKAMTKKISDLKKRITQLGLSIDIQVDGGIGLDNIYEVTKAGANIIVAGSAIYKSPDPLRTIADLKRLSADN
jgi:ribulose-phosphate 3-epimerase